MIFPTELTFRKKLAAFTKFVSQNGGEVLVPTNEWEIFRFDSAHGVGIVYFNAKGKTRFVGAAIDAWKAYDNCKPWKGSDGRSNRNNLTPKVRAILDRDGDLCFLCREEMGDDITVEHLVAIVHGGPKHISNLFLAHARCNEKLGHLSAVEKIRMREGYAKPVVPCTCTQYNATITVLRPEDV